MKTTARTSKITASTNGEQTAPVVQAPGDLISRISKELQEYQRRRVVVINSRNMITTRLQHVVASSIGYFSGIQSEDERTMMFNEARALIEKCKKGFKHPLAEIIVLQSESINGYDEHLETIEKTMVKKVNLLPVYWWTEQEQQRGFGDISLAKIIGETGDLRLYQNPAKVWRRMGCAPWTYNDKTQAGSTWKSKGGLPAEEWEKFGYCPRRRSIMYVISEGLMKQNTSVYRERYDEAKERAAKLHPDWAPQCTSCKGKGKSPKSGEPCKKCSGRGHMIGRCHSHALLLCGKLLLKNLWVAWREFGFRPERQLFE